VTRHRLGGAGTLWWQLVGSVFRLKYSFYETSYREEQLLVPRDGQRDDCTDQCHRQSKWQLIEWNKDYTMIIDIEEETTKASRVTGKRKEGRN
jgi:hypothetical protein